MIYSYQEAKIRYVGRKLTMFEEHLKKSLFVHFNGFFFRIFFLVEHITIFPGSRISLQNASKFYKENLEIWKISLKFHNEKPFEQNTSKVAKSETS